MHLHTNTLLFRGRNASFVTFSYKDLALSHHIYTNVNKYTLSAMSYQSCDLFFFTQYIVFH